MEERRGQRPLRRMAWALGMTDDQVRRLKEQAEELSFLATAFARS